jgi:hypothetical protein
MFINPGPWRIITRKTEKRQAKGQFSPTGQKVDFFRPDGVFQKNVPLFRILSLAGLEFLMGG